MLPSKFHKTVTSYKRGISLYQYWGYQLLNYVPVNLTSACKGHHISLEREETRSGLLARKEQNSGVQKIFFKISCSKSREIPLKA